MSTDSTILMHRQTGQLPRGPTHIEAPCLSIYIVYAWFFLCFNTDFVWSPNTINICSILSTIYIFIPVNGCVGRGLSALLCLGAYSYDAVKTTLGWFVIYFLYSWTLWNQKSTGQRIQVPIVSLVYHEEETTYKLFL